MPRVHVVKRGECLSQIALYYGFHNWKLIYQASENKSLRDRRPNPNVLHPGDEIVIPEKDPKTRDVATGQIHKHVLVRPKWKFRLILKDHSGRPIENAPFELVIDGGEPVKGTTSSEGLVECAVLPGARGGELHVFDEVIPVDLGALDPVTRISGVQARLGNLGFDPGPIDGIYGELTARAIYGFQLSQGLKPTGAADDATRKRLLKVHDGDDRCKAPEEAMVLPKGSEAPDEHPSRAVLLAPIAEVNHREIIIVGAQAKIADTGAQSSDDVSMNFYKAATSLTPDASNGGEAILYVEKSGYSAAMRARIASEPGFWTTVIFFDSLADLASKLGEWPSESIVRLTIIAHGYNDHIALAQPLTAPFFAPLARLFEPGGFIVSHACRTADASLAQEISNAAKVPVFAWTGRTSYGHKEADGSLHEIHPSEFQGVGKAWPRPDKYIGELISEMLARHGDVDRAPVFVRVTPNGPPVEGAKP